MDFRSVIARMLGLDVNTLAVADYEIIARIERIVTAFNGGVLPVQLHQVSAIPTSTTQNYELYATSSSNSGSDSPNRRHHHTHSHYSSSSNRDRSVSPQRQHSHHNHHNQHNHNHNHNHHSQNHESNSTQHRHRSKSPRKNVTIDPNSY